MDEEETACTLTIIKYFAENCNGEGWVGVCRRGVRLITVEGLPADAFCQTALTRVPSLTCPSLTALKGGPVIRVFCEPSIPTLSLFLNDSLVETVPGKSHRLPARLPARLSGLLASSPCSSLCVLTCEAIHTRYGRRKRLGRNGRAYLFTNVVNVTVGVKEDRQLITGLHTVADICCYQCQEVLGWKYEKAYEESQKYKEGKYILEKAKVMKEDW